MKVFFVLDNVRSAFNVGSFFRTADCLGYEIILLGISPNPQNCQKLEKTSLGTLDKVKWNYFKNYDDFINSLNRANSLICSVEEGRNTQNEIDLFELEKVNLNDYSNLYLIFGHEINGVSDELLKISNYVIKIPVFGTKNSLNVATCGGIVGYFIKRIIIG